MGSTKTPKINEGTFSPSEMEVVVLLAIIDTLNNILNHEVVEIRKSGEYSEVHFKSAIQQKFFNVILTDFLSKLKNKSISNEMTFLELLQNICTQPQFNQNNTISSLQKSTATFHEWINDFIRVETPFPSLNRSVDLRIKRADFIQMCGNISKHHFAHLTMVARSFSEIMKENGLDVDLNQCLIGLNDFYDHFHNDIFSYLSSYITEMLNEILWGIHDYLSFEYDHSLKIDKETDSYSYTIPKHIQSAYVKTCYWDLMNRIRSKPCLQRFKSPVYLKLRY